MNKNNIVKIIIIFIALAGIVLIGWLIAKRKYIKAPANQNNSLMQDASYRRSENIPQVSENKKDGSGQQKLSQEVPHYEKTEKIESYTLQYPNSSQVQDVYRFYSSRSVDENLSYYTDWAGGDGWTVANSVKEKSAYSLYLTRNQETLIIKISKDEGNNETKVNLDLLKLK